jgi:hypothetical protein
MWDPTANQTVAMRKLCPPARLQTSPKPAVIEDIIDEFDAPPTPIVVRHTAHGQYVHPPHARPATRSQLRARTVHMINCVISDALMPRPVTATAGTPPAIWSAFAVHQLVLSKLAANHFICAIIDKDTGTILEYRHLVKNPTTKTGWETSFTNKIGCLFQWIEEQKGASMCFFINKSQDPSNKQPTYGHICCNFCPEKKERIVPA